MTSGQPAEEKQKQDRFAEKLATQVIKNLQVQCERTHMRVNVEFDRPFYGMIFSKGHYSESACVHVRPGTGQLSATFDIYLNSCGMTSSANQAVAAGTLVFFSFLVFVFFCSA